MTPLASDLAAPNDERSGRSQHPSIDSALLEKVRQGVSELDRQARKPWDDNSERLSASLMLMAAEKGFTAKDDLKFAFNTPTPNLGSGEVLHMWRASNASPDPAANRAHMPTQEALSVPAEQRLTQVEALQQAKAEEIQRSQQQDVVQQQLGQARSL
ncbi:XVIPCD domain-containing protein [Xanthomonas campestris]|uniref:XVIPCD domain-containing protein n=1 Tax=Xanthomonas campestris TaxID=339 RepID=UPI002B233B1B|nr:XVIPCD domain-containing protein [Xanthomonas campestris]MEA9792139.1 XVIPCD domain-containing protein [Xanthomonas campestris pv. raphani]MEA9820216.1 XVIPCD domain-containing protein [Xanthomonas campestris pv. raphani]MEA9873246.1 XVIPCD domain-containing protein [Xanthomonas campestris pv. raphani]MEA9969205.1 XVIPCD domain-containing protein [Xanthomonas campestris pv. raphani]